MFSKKIKHKWEYLPYFLVEKGMIIAVQVCKKTGAAQYVRVPSSKLLKRMEEPEKSDTIQ